MFVTHKTGVPIQRIVNKDGSVTYFSLVAYGMIGTYVKYGAKKKDVPYKK